jgi:IS5 family transposase
MARITIASLQTKNAALEARLVIARDVYRAQKARIAELEAALATRGVKPAVVAQPKAEVKVSYFTKADGTVWQRTQCGSRAVVRRAEVELVSAECVQQ